MAHEPAQGLGALQSLGPLTPREETILRAAYGIGADSVQLEHRNRPFLTEDETVEAVCGRRGVAGQA